MNELRIQNHRAMNRLHTVLLLGGMALLLGLLGYLLGGTSGVLWAAFFGLLVLFFSRSASPSWVLRVLRARRLSPQEAPRLYAIVDELARRANLPAAPTLYLVPERMLNAFAIGDRSRPAIGVTTGLLENLDSRDLTNILAHEISHIWHNDLSVMNLANVFGRITRFLSFFGQFLLFVNLPLLLMGRATISWLAILLLVAAPSLSWMMQLALSRTREFDADLGAVRLAGDPQGMALALRKLERLQDNGFFGLFFPGGRLPRGGPYSTHPATEARVRRLQEIAAGAPPQPPYSGTRHRPTWRTI